MSRNSHRRIVWVLFARLCTIVIPDFFLKYIVGLATSDARQAWREKIALCILYLGFAGLILFWLEYLSTLFCDKEHTFNYSDVFKNDSKYAALNGKAVDWSHYTQSSQMAADVVQYNGLDVSPMFPTFMMLDRQGSHQYSDPRLQECIGNMNRSRQADNWLMHKLTTDPAYVYADGRLISCPQPAHPNITGANCYSWDYGLPYKGDIVYDMARIYNYTTLSSNDGPGKAYVVLNNKVLDVTDYLETVTTVVEVSTNIYSRAFNPDRMFFPIDLSILLYINLGQDITPYIQGNVSNAHVFVPCLEALFFKGIVQEPDDEGCERINPALWATMGVGLLYFLFKMNLANLCRIGFMRRLLFSSLPEFPSTFKHSWAYIILMIPCYAEPSETLKQTFESLARTNYDDSKKLLLFVCDGLVKSAQDTKETHLCILSALGYSGTEDPTPQPYVSLGQNRRRVNYAKVYSGYYETGRNRVPYLVVVKTGNPNELSSSRPPGNRGKRDSMVLVFGFLERCMNLANNKMTPLEYELFNQCYSVLGIDPRHFKYLLVNDADTQVQADVVQKMVSRLEKDRKMLAISGHVRPANPEQNLTTMLQIFPLYQTFYSGLAYEAFLGTVLSINGGFVMYKIWTENVPVEQKEKSLLFRRSSSQRSSQQTMHLESKWPKVSDEIPSHAPWDHERSRDSVTTGEEPRLSLSANTGIRPCCIHPTVLRGFAAPQADTLHMKNVLLLGEEQYLSIVLLRSHPHHRLGFEPEAIGYATLPTNFFALQGLQSRNLRAALHNQIEMHRVALHLGVSCWIVSLTKLLDMTFSMPIIVYLYGAFIRFFVWGDLAYEIIAVSFSCLIALHILYFIVRRQLKYILWFILYCLLAVPLFSIWFPLVAVWCSDYAERWYDVWLSSHKRRGRLHGIIDDSTNDKDDTIKDDKDAVESLERKQSSDMERVPRLQLDEYEVIEAEKVYQRAMQEAAALDSNFTGFTGFTGFVGAKTSLHSSALRNSGSFVESDIPSPPPALQLGGEYHNIHEAINNPGFNATSTGKIHGRKARQSREILNPMEGRLPSGSLITSTQGGGGGSLVNPFASKLDNPFDDDYAANPTFTDQPSSLHHKQSHSQSSYFTYTASTHDEELPVPEPPTRIAESTTGGRTLSGLGTLPSRSEPLGRGRSYFADTASHTDRCSIHSVTSNTFSIASSSLSMDPETSLEATRFGFGVFDPSVNSIYNSSAEINEEGRSSAQHGNVVLKIPGHTNTRGAIYTASTSLASPLHMQSTRRRRTPAVTMPTMSETTVVMPSDNAYTFHQGNTSDGTKRQQTASRSNSNGRDTNADLHTVIKQEIRSFLKEADLDSTTRAQVKQYLYSKLDSKIEHDPELQEFINTCIENVTLELLTR